MTMHSYTAYIACIAYTYHINSYHTLIAFDCHTLPSFLQVLNANDCTCGKFVLMFSDVCLFCFVRDLLGDKQEIWAYSPIEWARWFAKNFATPKDIERTES